MSSSRSCSPSHQRGPRTRTVPDSSFQRGPNTPGSCTGIAPLAISCACSEAIMPSASASSITKVRLRSLDDCEIRCTRSWPNVAQISDSRCNSERMPRPTRVIDAQGAITLTRQHFDRSSDSRASTSVLTRFSLESSETVTLVSDEPSRSTDSPCSRKMSNTSARKPTCCHMPTVSIDTRTMPPRRLIALTPGTPPATSSITVPGRSGRVVSRIASGTPASRQGPSARGCSTRAPVVVISCASA